jgi:hypothetical protein
MEQIAGFLRRMYRTGPPREFHMITSNAVRFFLFIAMAALALPSVAQIFDNPSNLQVLPKDTDPATLRDTMRHFALSTGLRCNNCHVAEEGQPMDQWDFSNDEKELKQKARVMLRMVNEINETHLGRYGDDRVRVQCVTCHRGVSKPRQIGEELALAAENGGPDGLKAHYEQLRDQYYGSHSYDFTEFTVSQVAREFAVSGDTGESLALLGAMLGDNPESISAHFISAEVKRANDDRDGALRHYRRLQELLPGSTERIKPSMELIAQRIAEIGGETTE